MLSGHVGRIPLAFGQLSARRVHPALEGSIDADQEEDAVRYGVGASGRHKQFRQGPSLARAFILKWFRSCGRSASPQCRRSAPAHSGRRHGHGVADHNGVRGVLSSRARRAT
jgi:hypothetical protein